MGLQTLKFLAIVLTALALAPAGAHLFALPNKIGLAQEAYFITQTVYRGWAWLGVVTIGAPLANLALAFALRGQGAPFALALAAFLCCAATLVVFFVWVYPTNVATDNWTTVPANWEALRAHWEYGHAANAALTFAALCLATLAALTSPETP